MAAFSKTDDLIKEYLLFRGFTATLKSFETELRGDKDRGLNVERLIEGLQAHVNNFDALGLRELWNHLKHRFFAHLDASQHGAMKKLELSLFRYYLANCIQYNKSEKVMEFFDRFSAEIQVQPEWKDWFILPWVKNPETNPAFYQYFKKEWQETFLVSLHNFLNIVIYSLPKPSLMSYESEGEYIRQLLDENRVLKQQVEELQTAEWGREISEIKVEVMDDFFVIPTSSSDKKSGPCVDILLAPPGGATKNTGLTPPLPTNNQPSPVPITVATAPYIPTAPQPQSKADKIASALLNNPATNLLRRTSAQKHGLSGSSQDCSTTGTNHDRTPTTAELPVLASTRDLVNESLAKDNNVDSVRSSLKDIPTSAPSHSEVLQTLPPPPFTLLSSTSYTEHSTLSTLLHCRFSPSGNFIATVDDSGFINILENLDKLWTKGTFVASKSTVLSLEWICKQDRYLAIGTSSGIIRLYDITALSSSSGRASISAIGSVQATGWLVGEFSTSVNLPLVVSLASSPTGHKLVSCSSPLNSYCGATLSVWNLKGMRLEYEIPLPTNSRDTSFPYRANRLTFNHNGNLLVCACSDGVVRILDIQRSECLMKIPSTGELDPASTPDNARFPEVLDVTLSLDELTIFKLDSDGYITAWSVQTGQQIKSSSELTFSGSVPLQVSNCYPKIIVSALEMIVTRHASMGCQFLNADCASTDLLRPVPPRILPSDADSWHWPATCLDWTQTNCTATIVVGGKGGKVSVIHLMKKLD